ncbi:MAG: HAD family hydrolase [Rhodoluna sp.]
MKLKSPALIALDMDNTLYEYQHAHEAGMKQVADALFSRLGIRRGDWENHFNWSRDDVKRRLGNNASSHSRLLYFKSMLERLGVGGHFDLALQLENTYWQFFLRAMQPAPGAKEFLEVCRARGLPVVLITDLTLQIQLRKILQLNFLNYIHGVITSEEVGGDKPNPSFIHYARENLGLVTSDTWVVGDDLVKDKSFAQEIQAEFFHVSADGNSKYSFDHLVRFLSK